MVYTALAFFLFTFPHLDSVSSKKPKNHYYTTLEKQGKAGHSKSMCSKEFFKSLFKTAGAR